MKREIYLSDIKKNFQPHKSLLDTPIFFETSVIKGCIFYLSPSKNKGGDVFIVRSDDCLTISLLGDMTGHGGKAREKLRPIMTDLDNLAKSAVSASYEKKLLVNQIIRYCV